MEDITKKYDQEFFDYTISSELASSSDLAQTLIKYYDPESVIDIGCGCGIHIKAFSDLGINDVIGYDGSRHAVEKGLLPGKILMYDIRKPLITGRKYDICLCIEVAEHIENEYSEILIETLTRVSDIVFFTAAPPGQGGLHHINEQPREFWTGLFQRYGFEEDPLTEIIRSEMKRRGVIFWITKNMMVYRRKQGPLF